MNSFNHYAYGSVADWLYGVAARVQVIDEAPGSLHLHEGPGLRLNSTQFTYCSRSVRYVIRSFYP